MIEIRMINSKFKVSCEEGEGEKLRGRRRGDYERNGKEKRKKERGKKRKGAADEKKCGKKGERKET